jgi:uncharacterized membrane protein
MIERLKSPVVWVQVLSIIAGAIIFFAPSVEEEIKIVVGSIIALINLFAGLNNPTDRENF